MKPLRTTGHEAPPWGWAALGALAGLLAGLLMFAPARWLAAALDAASAQQVRLLDARGSIWEGSARLALAAGAGSQTAATLPDRLVWRLRPAWNGLNIELGADCCTPQPLRLQLGLAGLSGWRLQLGSQRSRWPASLLGGLGAPWNTVQPQGQLELNTQELALKWEAGRLVVSGQLQLDALQISSRLSTLQPMGSYRFTLHGGPDTTLQLTTLEGSLQLTGQGLWTGQRLRFEGEASATPERVEALANLLNILGRRDGARSLIRLG